MIVLKFLYLLVLIPISWIHAFLIRSKPWPERYAICRKYCIRILKTWNIQLVVHDQHFAQTDSNMLVICNHQSTYDPLYIVAACPKPLIFVSKKENTKIPFLSSWAKTIEVFFFDRDETASAIHMLRETATMMKKNRSVLVFAEGTRSRGRQMKEMKPAAFKSGMIAKVPVLPMTLVNSYESKQLIRHGGVMEVWFDQPISAEDCKALKPEEAAQLVSSIMQKHL